MTSKYETFDRSRLDLLPLKQRSNLVELDHVLQVGQAPMDFDHADLPALADRMADARSRNAAVVLLMGAHVIKQGLSRYVIDLIRRGAVSVVAFNGAGAIHDYELATSGATSESVAHNIVDGRFGLWRETGRINDIVARGAADGLGFEIGRASCRERV